MGNRLKPDNKVSLKLLTKNGLQFSDVITNTKGRFKFENLDFTGHARMLLDVKNSKGKSKGMLVLDSFPPPLFIDLKKELPVETQQSNIGIMKEQVYKKYVLNGVSPENILEEVEIVAKKKNNISQYRQFGTVDFIYEPSEDEAPYTDIFQLLTSTIPGLRIMIDSEGNDILAFNRTNLPTNFGDNNNPSPPLIRVDNVPIIDDPQFLYSIQVNDVARVNAYKHSTSIFGLQGGNGVIYIFLKEPGNEAPSTKIHHSNTGIEGFYDARVFYSSNSKDDSSFEKDNKLDVHNTLYWNPYIHPDKTGHSQTSYYNTNVQAQVKVTLEGITTTGIPVVMKTEYNITK